MTDYPDFSSKGTKNCDDVDPEVFFPDEEAPDYRRRAYEAKEVCKSNGGCAYMAECLAWALMNENFGVWGGTTPEDRKALKRAAARQKRPSIYR